MSEDIYDYIYVSQGKTKVDSIDDNEELEYTEDAFNVLGFEAWEKFDCYMLTAGIEINSYSLQTPSLHLQAEKQKTEIVMDVNMFAFTMYPSFKVS